VSPGKQHVEVVRDWTTLGPTKHLIGISTGVITATQALTPNRYHVVFPPLSIQALRQS